MQDKKNRDNIKSKAEKKETFKVRKGEAIDKFIKMKRLQLKIKNFIVTIKL